MDYDTLNKLTVVKLRTHARENIIKLTGLTKKDEIIKAILDHNGVSSSSSSSASSSSSSASSSSSDLCTSKVCDTDKICNPKTGKCVLRSGKIGKEILSNKNPAVPSRTPSSSSSEATGRREFTSGEFSSFGPSV